MTSTATARPDALTIAPDSLAALGTALITALGENGAAQLRDAGFQTGDLCLTLLRERQRERGQPSPEALSLDDFAARTAELFRSLGWGELTLDASRELLSVVDVAEWAERRPPQADGSGGAHFTTGMLAGYFGALAGEPVAVLEIAPTIPSPGSARFLLGSVETIEAVFAQLERGARLEEAAGI